MREGYVMIEVCPEEFDSYEWAAEFWDTHDTTNYPDAFQTVDVGTAFRGRYYEIEIEADVAEVLQAHARQKGVTVSNLASELLRQQLATA
jgi:predicted phosphatase